MTATPTAPSSVLYVAAPDGVTKAPVGSGVVTTVNTAAGLKLPVLPWLSMADTDTEALPR